MAQYAGIKAACDGDADIEYMREHYDQRRKLLLKGLSDIGLECFEPEGAFYAFPDISAFGLTSQEFCEQLLERQKVVCIPGSAFGACGEGHIRVAYTCEEGMLQAAVERLHQFCREVRGA